MTEVLAAVARPGTDLFSVERLQLEEPRAGEARTRIVGAGICHTDLGMRPMATMAGPVVLGHEGAGVVEAIGEDVTQVKAGDRVIASFEYCGSCTPCRTGRVANCQQFARNFMAARADMTTSLTGGDGERVGSHRSSASPASPATPSSPRPNWSTSPTTFPSSSRGHWAAGYSPGPARCSRC